ncbi:TetR/AcrR family transcriptional regulator [Streptacidiphilus anmyonensis]|uniref:TetR/AcrR family transcriptional regulator n=1 Tax=Streptacidiphilus anmyonensis TaxID=405782 RepID=UPI00191C3705|nr:TetR/AcrR family transcriptional regulator [Streptacidiphilus anmyonensis]
MSIWMRPEVLKRQGPGPRRSLSRAQIAAAAVRIADEEGIEGASMRRIAAELGVGVMTLYHYIPNRDDLVELMVDQVAAESPLPERPSDDWRVDLLTAAETRRALWLRHPWLATRTPGHPVWGPNTLRQQEFVLGTLARFDLTVDELLSLIGLFSSYVEGFVRNEVGWAEEARRTRVDMQEWIRRAEPLARSLTESGRYPMFTRILSETRTALLTADERFRFGLERVLDSIAAALAE